MDGSGAEVRLQHPIGLAAADDRIYIADSYNHRVKVLGPTSGDVRTFLGTGEPGSATGAFTAKQLHEPEGLALIGDRLYIADTNNHRILVADLQGTPATTCQLNCCFLHIAQPMQCMS